MNIKSKIQLLITNPGKFFKLVFNVLKSRVLLLVNPDGNRFSTDLEVATLRKYAKVSRFGIVEIGVLDGKTTKEMAQSAIVPIYGIDPIIPDSMNKRLIGHETAIKRNLEFYKDFHFIKDFSYNVAPRWKEKFDFIFIDGDHAYEAVLKDFEDWFPLIEPNGIISFHDSAPVTSIPGAFAGWPGPTRLVAELKNDPRVEFLETQDSLSVFKKITNARIDK